MLTLTKEGARGTHSCPPASFQGHCCSSASFSEAQHPAKTVTLRKLVPSSCPKADAWQNGGAVTPDGVNATKHRTQPCLPYVVATRQTP